MKLFEQMQAKNVHHDIYTYNSLLSVAKRDERVGVMEAAMELYNMIPLGMRDQFTYPVILHIIANNKKKPASVISIARAIFDEARERSPPQPPPLNPARSDTASLMPASPVARTKTRTASAVAYCARRARIMRARVRAHAPARCEGTTHASAAASTKQSHAV
jgi:hypothetical protein